MKHDKKIRTTVKLDKSIHKKLEKYREYGYNKNEIITMGIILLEDSKNFELLLRNKQKEEETIKEMNKLKKSVERLNNKLHLELYHNKFTKLDYLIDWIYRNEFSVREEILTHCKNCQIESLGVEYFIEKAQLIGIPTEALLTELINRFTEEYLKQIRVDTEEFTWIGK